MSSPCIAPPYSTTYFNTKFTQAYKAVAQLKMRRNERNPKIKQQPQQQQQHCRNEMKNDYKHGHTHIHAYTQHHACGWMLKFLFVYCSYRLNVDVYCSKSLYRAAYIFNTVVILKAKLCATNNQQNRKRNQ